MWGAKEGEGQRRMGVRGVGEQRKVRGQRRVRGVKEGEGQRMVR